MTSSQNSGLDPQLVARLSSRFDSLGDHMRQVAVDLQTLQSQLGAATAPAPTRQASAPVAPAVPPPVASPHMPPQPYGQPFGHTVRQPTGQQMVRPQPAMTYPAPPRGPVVAPRPPAPPREPWWQRDGVISRLLAVAGAGVTLVGVVMLLVLAAQAGWFGPPLQVAAGAVFSLALIGAGVRVFGRSGGRIGGIALAATGIAGLYLDVLATSVLYGWLDPMIGLIAAFGIAAAGTALAVQWKSQPMAVLILAGVAVCGPVLTDGLDLTLIAFLIATYVASFPAQIGRNWQLLQVVRTVPLVGAVLAAIASADLSGSTGDLRLLLVVVSVAVVGIGTSLELLRRNVSDVVATVMIALTSLPVLVSADVFDRGATVALQLVLAAAAVTIVVLVNWLPVHARITVAVIGALATLQAAVESTTLEIRPVVLFAVALALIAVAHSTRSALAYTMGSAFGVIGALMFVSVSPPQALLDSDHAVGSVGIAVGGILLAATVFAFVYVLVELKLVDDGLQALGIVSGLLALYGLTAATVTLGIGIGGETTGFTAGHTAATIEWMIAAFALLAFGLRSVTHAHLALLAGLSLTAAAIAKLFLFDLVALDGLFRVIAFIAVGLLLLIAGTRYAKVFADRESAAVSS
ncbi:MULTISPECIES: DUF2339 domain-containing protein [unclassified Rhodococcus (in: high G+C Gram-positive bacteria)]|uniref:DUF2339 domain-containing protein n=1 Tax=unclassified Rhodococcus (in: high G+C Gram-positive bacteria) TaxID=192944 RepID=UPI0015C63B6D|nr:MULTISPECIES: DUF2339 domain-containing protein [unclassified Rhodococcus (in: high G+C Gram-positive bacteria)]